MPGRKSMGYDAKVQKPTTSLQDRAAVPVAGEVTVIRDRGGYRPESLDKTLDVLVKNARDGAELLQKYGPMLEGLMDVVVKELNTNIEKIKTAQAAKAAVEASGIATEPPPGLIGPELDLFFNYAQRASVIMERINKMALSAGKTLDDITRLRAFLATGDVEDPDGLDRLGEGQLRRIVHDAVAGFPDADGWQRPPEKAPS